VIAYLVFVLARLACVLFVMATAGYGVMNESPFAFDQFIRPGMLPWMTRFVAWHHLWYWGAWLASLVSIAPALGRSRGAGGPGRTARVLAWSYAAVSAAAGIRLVLTPFLPALWDNPFGLRVVIASLVPLLWLAAIDHALAAGAPALDADRALGQPQVLNACLATAAYVWAAHGLYALRAGATTTAAGWIMTAFWALLLDAAVFMILYAVLALIIGAAAGTARPRVWQHALVVALIAWAIGEVLARMVFPSILLERTVSAVIAAAAGVTFALTWSGIALRRPRVADGGPLAAALLLVLLPLAAFAALHALQQMDWNYLLQKLTVLAEWTAAFALMLTVVGRRAGIRSIGWTVGPPLAALACLFGAAHATPRLAAWSGDPHAEPRAAIDRYGAIDPAFGLVSEALVAHASLDPGLSRYLQLNTSVPRDATVRVPDVEFAASAARPAGDVPSIFLIAIDSLRRDYLSPYNPAVTFTPRIQQLADESFVFRNAFTRYGGTALGMRSLWAGGPLLYRVLPDFAKVDAIEKLIDADGYRLVIDDDLIPQHLRASTPRTVIDPHTPHRRSDLCRVVDEMEADLDRTGGDPRPVFAYSTPMNVHGWNLTPGPAAPDGRLFPGFFAPYAAALQRADACVGGLVSYLKRTGRYETSIIVLTADHGDSLGEGGHWGHASWLFPEDVRIPLIIHIPAALRATQTTDLARIAFGTDIAPTLYGLLGHAVRDLGPLFGSPLFVPADRAPISRRRACFLINSSYAPTYGVLCANGRSLYVVDVAEGRELAFDLTTPPLGLPVPITGEIRRAGQRMIRDRVEQVAALYHLSFAR
jgi:sulfatase-like protein